MKKPKVPDVFRPIKLQREQFWKLKALMADKALAEEKAAHAVADLNAKQSALAAYMASLGLDPNGTYQGSEETGTLTRQGGPPVVP